jgi:hypothetical protein
MVPIYLGEIAVTGNYRLIGLASVVCKQMEHVIAGYLRQILEMNERLYKGQHCIRPEYFCESLLFTVCKDIADSLDEEVRTDTMIIDFIKAFDLVAHDRVLTKIVIVAWIKKMGSLQRE